jgi:hyaluronoglucosaminidase
VTAVSGIIEGFYGPPWTHAARLRAVEHLADWGLTHYVWAPKSEPRHRDRWRQPFTDDELIRFAALAGHRSSVALAVALTPGPDATVDAVVAKLRPAVGAGADQLVLSFDDVPEQGAGARHRDLTVGVRAALGVPVWVVPTHYAGQERSPYLDELCAGLPDDSLLMWTGPAVVTDEITAEQARARTVACGGRRPLLWDNVPVNDGPMADRLSVGPLEGREPALRGELAGALWNPMLQAEASLLTLASAAAWWRGDDPEAAWRAEVERRGLTTFVGGVLGRGLPTDPVALRAALQALRDCDAPGLGDEVAPWIDALHAEAGLGVVALDVLAMVADGAPDPERLTELVFRLLAWRRVRSAPVSVFGGRLATRPILDQDDRGHFRIRPGMVVERDTVVDGLVRDALGAVRALG